MTTHQRLLIEEQPVKDVSDSMIVVNDPWHMDLLQQHKLYFFNPDKGQPTLTKYILFYETMNKNSYNGKGNTHARHIGYWGQTKEIIYDVSSLDFPLVPELRELTKDPYFWNHIKKNNDPKHVIVLSEIGKFDKPIPLKDKNSITLIGKTATLPKLRNAAFAEELYKG